MADDPKPTTQPAEKPQLIKDLETIAGTQAEVVTALAEWYATEKNPFMKDRVLQKQLDTELSRDLIKILDTNKGKLPENIKAALGRIAGVDSAEDVNLALLTKALNDAVEKHLITAPPSVKLDPDMEHMVDLIQKRSDAAAAAAKAAGKDPNVDPYVIAARNAPRYAQWLTWEETQMPVELKPEEYKQKEHKYYHFGAVQSARGWFKAMLHEDAVAPNSKINIVDAEIDKLEKLNTPAPPSGPKDKTPQK